MNENYQKLLIVGVLGVLGYVALSQSTGDGSGGGGFGGGTKKEEANGDTPISITFPPSPDVHLEIPDWLGGGPEPTPTKKEITIIENPLGFFTQLRGADPGSGAALTDTSAMIFGYRDRDPFAVNQYTLKPRVLPSVDIMAHAGHKTYQTPLTSAQSWFIPAGHPATHLPTKKTYIPAGGQDISQYTKSIQSGQTIYRRN